MAKSLEWRFLTLDVYESDVGVVVGIDGTRAEAQAEVESVHAMRVCPEEDQ